MLEIHGGPDHQAAAGRRRRRSEPDAVPRCPGTVALFAVVHPIEAPAYEISRSRTGQDVGQVVLALTDARVADRSRQAVEAYRACAARQGSPLEASSRHEVQIGCEGERLRGGLAVDGDGTD